MPDPERYTLDEARAELARRECEQHGHNWTVDNHRTYADPGGTPGGVYCERCQYRFDMRDTTNDILQLPNARGDQVQEAWKGAVLVRLEDVLALFGQRLDPDDDKID